MSDKLIAITVIKRITISTRDRIMPFSPEASPEWVLDDFANGHLDKCQPVSLSAKS
jgi:hypothetical protein